MENTVNNRENDVFHIARARAMAVTGEEEKRVNIGVYREKLLHATLKFFYQPNEEYHEVDLGPLVADACICDEDGVTEAIEIQTGSCLPLRKKLEKYTAMGERVRIVMPMPYEKRLVWVTPETGEMSPPRRSPRKGRVSDALKELYFIKDHIGHAGVTVEILFIDMDEYRYLDGWGKGGKRGSHRSERYPAALRERYTVRTLDDCAVFVPATLGESFTAADYARETRLTSVRASRALRLLLEFGTLTREKEGRRFVYRRKESGI